MPDFTPRLPSRGTVFRSLSIATIVIAVVLVATAIWVYYESVQTFEVRRVSLPTRVYTDLIPLEPGRALDAERLEEKLERLGYRDSNDLSQPGAYRRTDAGWEIHLRGFDHPTGEREPARVRVRLGGGEIEAVEPLGPIPPASPALEPELLTSIMGDQLENRNPVPLDAVPQHLIDAVIVAEDARFFQHPGVDPLGILRALVRNIRSGEATEGGSTLTQQLVKNYYLTNERTLRRKVVEAFMALILDAKYSKEEILEAYLNDIYLGRNRSISILGVGQAARFYFGKPVDEVTPAEAALLAAMIPSPNNYSPFEDPELAKQRRGHLLEQMREREKLTEQQYREAIAEPLPEKPFRERTGLGSIPYYVDRVLQEMRRDYGIDDVEGRGLNIYTAIDLDWQAAATRELQRGLERLERSSRRLRNADDPLQGAVIAVDVHSGEIRALVGGRNWEKTQFNRAISAERQVGSLFKPFVYLAAFEPSLSHTNITPATLVNDEKFVLERRFAKDWSPSNYGGRYYGVVTVRQALEKSLNAASVRIGLAAGVGSAIRTAHALGIERELDPNPSIILGAVEIVPIEMAEAYATMARLGSRIPLRAIRYVTNEDGAVVSDLEIEEVQVFPARDVYLAVHLMEGVMNRGTAAGARALGFRKTAAGKTGTTDEKRDAWFIGFTPQTLAVTWVGFDDNDPTGLSGSDGAVPIWARVMRQITSHQEDTDFPVPGGIVFVESDVATGALAVPQCPPDQVLMEAFKAGTEPRHLCPIHQPRQPVLFDEFGYPLDPYGVPIGPDGMPLPPTDTTMTGTSFEPLPPIDTTLPDRDPVLEGGRFPRPEPPPPTTTNPPVVLPRPLPDEPQQKPPEPEEKPPVAEEKPPNQSAISDRRSQIADWVYSNAENTRVAFVPPKPNEFERAWRTSASRIVFGT
ncbi:MAG: PBP1A family penicillin-binding protein [Thermoanaerobaculia bacterium]